MAYHGPNPGRSRRTITKAEFDAAQEAWRAGEFSDEWKPWRHLAAMQAGIAGPPEGSRWDSWGDDSPSQRAILIRAIRETPELLRAAILGAPRPTWGCVIERLIHDRAAMADEADERAHQAEAERLDHELTPRQATYRLAEILDVIGGSR